MRETLFNTLIISALALLLAACGAEISDDADDFEPSAGIVDFTTFVALGDSLTAGYADGALYRHGQVNSYPAIMARQFVEVGGGAFDQPLMEPLATGSLTLSAINLGLSDRLVLVPTGNPDRPASPAAIAPPVSTEIGIPLLGPFNNIGVPGAKSYHVTAANYGDAAGVGGGTANPFFVRFRSAAATSMAADAATLAPTFFVLWIGNNDVLSYATSGGVGVQGVGLPPYGSNDITDPAFFPAIYNGILGAINTPTNHGVLVNIPDVTTIPYFTTVPFNSIPLDAATATTLNGLFAAYNGGVNSLVGIAPGLTAEEAARRQINFVAGNNRILILDDSLTDLTGFNPALTNMRQANADDYIVLPTASKLGTEQIPGNPSTVWGVSNPLLDADVLTASEVAIVEAARNQFNAAIATAAGDPTLTLLDAEALLEELNSTGILYGSGGISSTFAQGGGFSLDGVHPTARGYAVIANEMFNVIRQAFGANIRPVNPGDFTTVFYQ